MFTRVELPKIAWKWFLSAVFGTSIVFLLLQCRPEDASVFYWQGDSKSENIFQIHVARTQDGAGVNNPKENNSPLRCDTCALVGTAGTLMDSKQGPVIDSASCIFRLGFSPVDGREPDIGSRTTVRITDSFRFSPFLKRLEKLFARRYATEQWYLFDVRSEDESRYREKLEPIQGMMKIHWFSKQQELEAANSLKKYAGSAQYNILGGRPSSLWFAVQLMENANCQQFAFYGVPDPKLCKREADVEILSRYWDQRSGSLCRNGQDAGVPSSNSKLPLETPSLLERRALRVWALSKKVSFLFPKWPNS